MALQKNPLLTEATVNLIIDQIKSNFNSLVADVDNQNSDGISLEPLDNDSIYLSDKYETLRPPAVFVLFQEHAFQYSKDPNYLDSVDKCIVVVSCEDIGASNLTRKSWRYGRVIYGCLNFIDLVDTTTRLKIKTIPKRLGYTQPIASKLKDYGKKYRIDTVLDLDILHYENFLT